VKIETFVVILNVWNLSVKIETFVVILNVWNLDRGIDTNLVAAGAVGSVTSGV